MGTHNFQTLQRNFTEKLKKSYQIDDITELKVGYEAAKASDIDKKAALDQSFREVLLEDIIGSIPNMEAYIAFSIDACRNDMVTSTMPIVLLGDIFDAVTLDQCELMFTYVENNVLIWKEECFFAACKNNLLRMCNDLLRRLSRSQNTVFCGRILLFLAKFFPFSERSGLNIVSEFNLENLTEYGGDEQDMSESLDDTSSEQPLQIDYNLYCKFWSLQDYFRNPNQCYNIVQWKTFATHASSVLSAFSSFKLEEPRESTSKSNSNKQEEQMDTTPDGILREQQHFFAKFLTNPKLLALQLSDSNFRRSVLVQFLILFQYLTSTVKFKADSYNLTQLQSDWIKETETLVYKLLEETPPQGKKFAQTVQHMLQREELWNNWKNEGCKEFKRPEPVQDDCIVKPAPKRPKKHLGDLIKDSNKVGKFYMGNPELTRLWNLCPDNLLACKGADRDFLPSLEAYLENPKEKSDPSFEWRALRLLARQSPHFFTLFNTPSYKVSDYLDSVRKKIQKDRAEVKEIQEEIVQSVEQIETENDNFVEEQMEAELLKTEQLTPEDKNNYKPTMITPEQLQYLAPIIAPEWKKLATKLGYSTDEILFFETENPTITDQCRTMLQIWFEDDMDASLDSLAYTLEGLEMLNASEAVKRYIPPADKMEDISE